MKNVMKKLNKKGFTLAELLIVVAIIAVLVAISIPIFSSQLEKAREATDLANVRSAYAEVAASALTDPDTDKSITVTKIQTQNNWEADGEIAGIKYTKDDTDFPGGKGTIVVAYTASDGKIKIGNKEVPKN